jgi:hypothetical protein
MGCCHGKLAEQGEHDDLILAFNIAGLKGYLDTMRRDEAFLVTAELVGHPIPTTAAEAAALLATLEAKGGDNVDEFKAPIVCRVLKDKTIDWAAEAAGGGRLFEVVGRFLNGYDGLAVRRVGACITKKLRSPWPVEVVE